VEFKNLSFDLKKMVTLFQNLVICTAKSLFFGENSADRKLRYIYCRLRENKVLAEEKTSSGDLCTLGRANKITASGTGWVSTVI
jgi:hypothetical protein